MFAPIRAIARKWVVASALALSVAAVAMPAGAALGGAPVPTIGTMRLLHVPQTKTLQSVVCSGVDHCFGAGKATTSSTRSRMFAITNKKIAKHVESRSGAVVLGSACTATTCLLVAKGDNHSGLVMEFQNGKLHSTRVQRKVGEFEAVSCEGNYRCFAVGRGLHNVAQLTAIKPSGVPIKTTAVPGAADLDGINCRADGDCLAVGKNASGSPIVVRITDGLPDNVVSLLGKGELTGVGCTGNADCDEVGTTPSGGGMIVDSDPGGGSRRRTSTAYPLYAVDCFEASLCIATGSSNGHGIARLINGGEIQSATTFDSTGGFNSVDCPTANLCYVASSSKGDAAIALIKINGMTQPA